MTHAQDIAVLPVSPPCLEIFHDLKPALGVTIGLWALAVSVLPFFPVDETRYLSVAWEMYSRHSFLIPLLNGSAYYHKPPLLFWMIIGLWKLFTVNEFLPRLIPLFFSLGNLILVHRISSLLWPENKKIPRVAILMIAGCPVWIFFSSAIMFDMVLTFWVLLCLWGTLRAGEGCFRGWLVAGVGLGCGLLTKGPVIFIHVLPCMVLYKIWVEEKRSFDMKSMTGFLVFLSIGTFMALAWAVPAAFEGGRTFSRAIFWNQTAGRVVSAFAHGRPLWWYLPLLPLLFFPWGVWPGSWKTLFSLKKDKGTSFCLVWFLSALVLFSLISGKQLHYLIPEIPAFVLMVARGIDGMAQKKGTPHSEMSLVFLYILLGLCLLFLPFFNPGSDVGDLDIKSIIPVASGIFCLGIVLRLFPRNAYRDKAGVIAFSSVVFVMILYCGGQGLWNRYDLKKISLVTSTLQEKGCKVFYSGKYQGEFQFLGRFKSPIATVGNLNAFMAAAAEHPEYRLIIKVDRKSIFPGSQVVYQQRYKNKKLILLKGLHD